MANAKKHSYFFRPEQIKKPCKLTHCCEKINTDLLNSFIGLQPDLATSVEKAVYHLAVGEAFFDTRFSLLCLPFCVANQGFGSKQQVKMGMMMNFRCRVAIVHAQLFLAARKKTSILQRLTYTDKASLGTSKRLLIIK